MLKRWYRWFLARFRLDLKVVCEESAGLGPRDYHDYDDEDFYGPVHFLELTCRRCGKKFYV